MAERLKDFDVKDGIPYYASLPEDWEVCCDCHLTHKVKYRIEDSNGDPVKGARLKIWVWRSTKETQARRTLPAGVKGHPALLVDMEVLHRKRRMDELDRKRRRK